MRHQHRFTGALFAAIMLLATAGCLSVGGKTYTTDSPDTDKRLSSLETRVGVLERALIGVQVPGGGPVPSEAVPGIPAPGGSYAPPGSLPPRASIAPYSSPGFPPR